MHRDHFHWLPLCLCIIPWYNTRSFVENRVRPYCILPASQALFTTLSSLNSMSTIPSLVTAFTVIPLKSIGILLFNSSVHMFRILIPWPRVISGWWCLSSMERQ